MNIYLVLDPNYVCEYIEDLTSAGKELQLLSFLLKYRPDHRVIHRRFRGFDFGFENA